MVQLKASYSTDIRYKLLLTSICIVTNRASVDEAYTATNQQNLLHVFSTL